MLNDFLEQDYPIECKGRDENGEEALDIPVKVKVKICKVSKTTIISDVKCPYNTGGHGQRCKASHPKVDKVGEEGIGCPYSVDIPYAFEKKK